MFKKRKTSRKRKTQPKKKKKSLLKLWMIQFTVILACVFLSYCVWIDFQIRKEFEGKRWSEAPAPAAYQDRMKLRACVSLGPTT